MNIVYYAFFKKKGEKELICMRNRYKITRQINKNTDRMALSFYAVKNFIDIYRTHCATFCVDMMCPFCLNKSSLAKFTCIYMKL